MRTNLSGKAIMILAAMLLLGFGISTASAAPPPTINYQGYITDSTGTALDGNYHMNFSIYTVSSGSTPLWTEQPNSPWYVSVLVSKGIFNYTLGSITTINLPFDNQYYLEVMVGGEVLFPRQPLTNAGYAFTATQAMGLSSACVGCVTQNMLASGITVSAAPHTHDGSAITSGTIPDNRISSTFAKASDVANTYATQANFLSHATDTTTNVHKVNVSQIGAVNKHGDTMDGMLNSTISTGTGTTAGSFVISWSTNSYPALYATTNSANGGLAGRFDGNVQINGTLNATTIAGSGANLTAASVPDTALTSNIALLNRPGQVFSGTNTFSSQITANGGVNAQLTGNGYPGYFVISNPASPYNAVYANTNGTANGIYSNHTGTANAGYFAINNPTSTYSGVYAQTNGTGQGVYGYAIGNGIGVRGYSSGTGYGVLGSSGFIGVYGTGANYGVDGFSSSGYGVYGQSSTGYGLYGNGTGSGIGVYGTSASGYSGYFTGGSGVYVNGNLQATTINGNGVGNSTGNIPVSNGTVNANLNADMVGGQHLTDLDARYLNTSGSDNMTGSLSVVNSNPSGTAGNFIISNASSTSPAVFAMTNGVGGGIIAVNTNSSINPSSPSYPALMGIYTGMGNGQAAHFEISQPTNTAAQVMDAMQWGLGNGSYFGISNPANTKNALIASSNGSGDVLYSQVTGTGTGAAANFQNFNASNTRPPLVVGTSNATGYSAQFTGGAGILVNGGLVSTGTITGSGSGLNNLNGSNVTSGIVPVLYGGTGTNNGSITGTGALTYTSGGNGNITLNPGSGNTIMNASGGNVGIGTTTPTLAKLQTAGMVGNTAAIFGSDTSGVSIINAWPGIAFNSYYNGGNKSLVAGAGGGISFDPGGGSMQFSTSPSTTGPGMSQTTNERMRITNAGNVGIGTSSPGTKLAVQASSANDGLSVTDGTRWVELAGGSFGAGSYNGIVQANDNALIFTGGTMNTGNFVIAPWTSGAVAGLRMTSAGNVGIGTGSPANALDVFGNINTIAGYGFWTNEARSGGMAETGGAGTLGFRTGNTDNRMFIDTGGNVGIGTASPISRLHVYGGDLIEENGDIALRSGSMHRWRFQYNTGGGLNFYQVYNNAGLAQNVTRMQIADSGNVGIGTTAPSQTLEISNANVNYQMRVGAGSINSQYTYDIGRNWSDGKLHFYGNQPTWSGYVFEGVAGEYMRIANDGKVGIGTPSPQGTFQVNSPGSATTWNTVFLQPSLANGNYAYMFLGRSTTTNDLGTISFVPNATATLSSLRLGTYNSSDILTITGAGNVGIGTTNPSADLHVNGNIRTGNETGTSEAPAYSEGGMVVRRINSTNTAAGQIVARVKDYAGNVLTLERDGSSSGFRFTYGGTTNMSINCSATTAANSTINRHFDINTVQTTTIYSSADAIVYLNCLMGNPFSNGPMTSVTLQRWGSDYFWAGFMMSTINQ